MSSPDDIQEKVARSLHGTPFESSELLRLDGGIANFTYRGVLVASKGYSTIIVKHAEPYMTTNSSFALDTIRSLYEHLMLGAASRIDFNATRSLALCNSSITTVNVTSPEPYAYFPESSTLVLQDFSLSTNLKEYAQKLIEQGSSRDHSVLILRKIGIALGSAIKKFHSWGATAPQVSTEEIEVIRKKLRANTMPKRIKYRVNYGHLVETIDRFPGIESSRDILGLVEKSMYAEMVEDENNYIQILHGDFWTGNILVTEPQVNGQENKDSKPMELAIIDWEFTQLGHPSWDLGQMLAEMYLLSFFSKSPIAKECSEGLIKGLIYGYERGNERIDAETQYRIAISVGAHFLGITSRMTDWGLREQAGLKAMAGLVNFGAELIVHGWKGLEKTGEEEREWFRFGPLHAVFFS